MRLSRFATQADKRLVLFVPQLDALLREAARTPPLIASLIRRMPAQSLNRESPQTELALDQALPAAALTRRLDRPDDANGSWLRADPIGLTPDLAAVWLDAERVFEPGKWRAELVELFRQEGLQLELTPSGRGYVRLDQAPGARFLPPWALAGLSLERCLPDGDNARFWRRLLNETQVVLQQYRQSAGQDERVPGSLWFWGGGELPDCRDVTPRVERIVAKDPVLVALADWLDLPHECPAAEPEPRGGSLLEWVARHEESAEDNLERLQSLLRTAWRRLRLGRIRELELAGMTSRRLFTPADAWRLWR